MYVCTWEEENFQSKDVLQSMPTHPHTCAVANQLVKPQSATRIRELALVVCKLLSDSVHHTQQQNLLLLLHTALTVLPFRLEDKTSPPKSSYNPPRSAVGAPPLSQAGVRHAYSLPCHMRSTQAKTVATPSMVARRSRNKAKNQPPSV